MKLKQYIPIDVKNYIKYVLSGNNLYNMYSKKDKKIFLMLAANYGNLGDVAITYAQKKFLQDNFKEYKVIEVPIDKTYVTIKSIKKICSPNDVITIIGGGNMGNKYDSIEAIRRFVIKKFKHNKIVSFPQTIDFSNDKKGKKSLNKTIKTYSKNKNLYVFAREKISYEKMKQVFKKNEVYLVPDIVLSLNETDKNETREYITTCFRNDTENFVNNDSKEKLKERLKELYRDKLIVTDTHIGDEKIEEDERLEKLEKIWSLFRKSKIVITDRLHGMIFCAITNTPCIALKNSNHKISETYNNFLCKKDNIYLMEKFNEEEILNIVKKYETTISTDDKLELLQEYKKLIEIINK